MPTAFDIIVNGKVQGVFYRASTREKVIELGLSGWCMNLPNGDVQIHAEGEREALNSLLMWCKVGPPRAIVDSVDFKEVEFQAYSEFSIKRY
ncbi:MAG: acylphosphatase [Cytophagia bacterium]|nr:acylphosphatase [Cytophagia bacterium]